LFLKFKTKIIEISKIIFWKKKLLSYKELLI
jgi:hypothetical protein